MKTAAMTTLVLFFLCGLCFGQNLVGQLNGELGPGTYHIVGNVSVMQSDSLVIHPGTTFIVDGVYIFGVYGYLYAVGTEQDSIIFYRPGSGFWNGVDFNPSTNDNSILEYCRISRSETHGIQIFACNPTISHCVISNNNDDSAC